MSETLEYIDRYFSGELSPSEKTIFENRCESDHAFADQVASYVSARATIEAESDLLLKKRFDELYEIHSREKKTALRTMFPYLSIAAAILVIVIGWFYFYSSPSSGNSLSSKETADRYVNSHLLTISTTLAANPDSLELGKIAFNKKNYDEAEKIFSGLGADTGNIEAVEYLGIVYLVTNKYDKAITQFEALSRQTTLHANFGPFYTAVTLMKRNNKGDQEKARIILEEIINKNLPGSEEARQWIKLLPAA